MHDSDPGDGPSARQIEALREELRLQRQIVLAANVASSAENLMRLSLDCICRLSGWPVGRVYLAEDAADDLRLSPIWYMEQPERFRALRSTALLALPIGTGLAGRALATGSAQSCLDLAARAEIPDAALARELGIAAAFAFPVVSKYGVVAVLEFLSASADEPSESIVELLAFVGAQIGRVVERKRTEAELREARARAEDADRAKSTFLAVMSHELRTPMSAVIGLMALLLDTELTDEQRDYVDTVRRSGEALLSVVSDILDFSKIEAGHLDLERRPLDVRSSVATCIDMLSHAARAKGIALTWSADAGVPATFVGDAERLRQVLLNLVGNAIKFTSGGEVSVHVAAQPLFGSSYEFRFDVRDTGIGIPADRLPMLFQAFRQAEASTSRRFGGTGLGLAISKRLVELMDGHIWVESEAGCGSMFSFTLAAVTLDEPTGEREPAAVAPSRGPLRVLVVDDNAVSLTITRRMLEKLGHRPDVVTSGAQALDAIARERYDVALMDLQMPGMDGLETTQRIRAASPAGPRVVILTANASDEDRQHCLASGADAYITKPLRVDELTAALGTDEDTTSE